MPWLERLKDAWSRPSEFHKRCPACNEWNESKGYVGRCDKCGVFIERWISYHPKSSLSTGSVICTLCGWYYSQPILDGWPTHCQNVNCANSRLNNEQSELQNRLAVKDAMRIIYEEKPATTRSTKAPPPSPVSPPVKSTPTPVQALTPLEELLKLQETALHEFRNHPFKQKPTIAIEPPEHFPSKRLNWLIRAHYEVSRHIICFNRTILDSNSHSELLDIMIHEHVHAWMTENDLEGDEPHGKSFETACRLIGIPFNPEWPVYDAE